MGGQAFGFVLLLPATHAQGPTSGNEDRLIDPNWTDSVDFSSCFENVYGVMVYSFALTRIASVLTSIPAVFLLIFGTGRIIYLLKTRPDSRSFLHNVFLWKLVTAHTHARAK